MNTLKTTVLLTALTVLLVGIGYFVGGLGGMIVFFVLAAVMNMSAYWGRDRIALRMAGAHEVTEAQEPQLFKMVAEVAARAQMPMPKLFVIETATPNAFATGRSPEKGVVAVTTGIRRLLNENELKAVIGHEIGHVKNRDTLTSSIAATIAGAISMISFMLLWFGGGRSREGALLSILIMILAPIAASIIQFAISRTREFAADEFGANLTRDPESLASALLKLEQGVQYAPMQDTPQQEAIAALYIVHPFRGGGMGKLFSTHPPTKERVERLRKMTYSPKPYQRYTAR